MLIITLQHVATYLRIDRSALQTAIMERQWHASYLLWFALRGCLFCTLLVNDWDLARLLLVLCAFIYWWASRFEGHPIYKCMHKLSILNGISKSINLTSVCATPLDHTPSCAWSNLLSRSCLTFYDWENVGPHVTWHNSMNVGAFTYLCHGVLHGGLVVCAHRSCYASNWILLFWKGPCNTCFMSTV